MQFPGMSTDPVRVRLEVTWWPEDVSFSLARSVWSRPTYADHWLMEGLEVSGSPIRLSSLPDRWDSACDVTLAELLALYRDHLAGDPFRNL